VNWSIAPLAIDGFVGVTAIDTNAFVTVSTVEPLIDPEVASIVVLPVLTPVARPALLTVATAVLLEVHVTEFVRFCWLPSLYAPVAVNCCVAPFTMDGLDGVREIETRVGGVTVRVVDPLIEPEIAWMVVLPVPTPVAKPAFIIVATLVLLELHVTKLVRFCWEPSL
jgi:hypothetical protein